MSEGVVSVLQALDFAARKHAGQRRKGSAMEPYVNHLIEVACLLAEATHGQDLTLILAALLHDTLEDTGTTCDELTDTFGEEVCNLVLEVSDDKSLRKQVRKHLQVVSTPHKTIEAKMLKLADKTSNLRSVVSSPPVGWDLARKLEYFEWARKVVESCRGVNPELEAAFDQAYQEGMKKLG